MSFLKVALLSGVTAIVVAGALWLTGPVNAGQSKRATADVSSLVISSDVLLGSEIYSGAVPVDTISDFLVMTADGKIDSAIAGSGSVYGFQNLEWNRDAKRFDLCSGEATRAENSAGHSGDTEEAATGAVTMFLLSKMSGLEIQGYEMVQEDPGDTARTRDPIKVGVVNGLFVDASSGHVLFLTTPVGGVMGLGTDSKVIPWCAAELVRGPSALRFDTRLTVERLERAPSYGTASKQLHNPEFRSLLYAYYGVDRPSHDRTVGVDHAGEIVTLDGIIGTSVTRASGTQDKVSDLMIEPKSGRIVSAVFEGGGVIPIQAIHWDSDQQLFTLRDEKAIHEPSSEGRVIYVLATALAEREIMVENEAVGSVESLYFDTGSNQLSFLSFAVGQTLGMGGEVKVVTWSHVSSERKNKDEQPELRLLLSKAQLKGAPSLDGEAGADLHNPTFRDRVTTYCMGT
jgi:hypothetical protein